MNCLYCNNQISDKLRKGTKYCSRDCRLKHYREQKAENNKRFCVICGRQLSGRARKACSAKCRIKYASRRRREHKSAYISKVDKYTESMAKKRPEISLEYIARECKKEGLTYGQYCVKHKLYEGMNK